MQSKKHAILLCALSLAGYLPAIAQLPDVSTEAAPKWYYVQVLGDDSRSGLVFTVTDANKVKGQALSTSLDLNEVGRQLWRFEKNAAGRYTLINRATGRLLDVAYDEDEGSAVAVVGTVSAQTFKFNPLDDYYQIELAQAVTDGERWLHQGNSGYSYAIITVGTTYGSGSNSRFRFVAFEDPNISFSDGQTETYYRLANASADFGGQAVRENEPATSDADASAPGDICLASADDSDTRAQWRAVNTGKGVRWINRATGHVLQTAAEPYGLFNILRAGTVVATGNSWTASYLGDKQYAFSAVDSNDRIERYMGASDAEAEAANKPDLKKLSGSPFAWRLERVETVATAIAAYPTADTGFQLVGRTIVGRSCRIHTLSGVSMPVGQPLQPGIYLVTAGGKTTKVIVK